MATCDECGNHGVERARVEGVDVLECGLCGALSGDDAAVETALLRREARERGVAPGLYPMLRSLERLLGLRALAHGFGDTELLTWPFVQLQARPNARLEELENLVKSLALSAAGHDLHWVLELEFQSQLVLTLKPRFHRRPGEIDAGLIRHAREDLQRVRRNLEAHAGLSWWRRRSEPGPA